MVIVTIATTVKVARTVLAPPVRSPTMMEGGPTEGSEGLSDCVISTTTAGGEEGRSDEEVPPVIVPPVDASVSVPTGIPSVSITRIVAVVGAVVLVVGVALGGKVLGGVPGVPPSSQTLAPSPDPNPLPENESIDPSFASTVTLSTW